MASNSEQNDDETMGHRTAVYYKKKFYCFMRSEFVFDMIMLFN